MGNAQGCCRRGHGHYDVANLNDGALDPGKEGNVKVRPENGDVVEVVSNGGVSHENNGHVQGKAQENGVGHSGSPVSDRGEPVVEELGLELQEKKSEEISPDKVAAINGNDSAHEDNNGIPVQTDDGELEEQKPVTTSGEDVVDYVVDEEDGLQGQREVDVDHTKLTESQLEITNVSGHQEEVVVQAEEQEEEKEKGEDETEGGADPAVDGAKVEDRFYNNKAFEQPDVDPSNPDQQDAALTIQTKYRQHHAKQVVLDKRQEAAATTIQAGFRGMHDRQQVKDMKTAQDSASQKADSEANAEEEANVDLDDPEVTAAATTIQAGFKGYKARQEVQTIKDQQKPSAEEGEASEEKAADAEDAPAEEAVDIDLDDPEVQAAATKIQAGFKGMKVRQDMAAKKEAGETKPEEKEETKEEETKEEETKEEETKEEETKEEETKEEETKEEETKEEETKEEETKEEETKKEEAKPDEEKKEAEETTGEKEEEVDIDLNDPEVAAAATKIQAGFKGYKTRKDMQDKQLKSADAEKVEDSEEKPSGDEEKAEDKGDKPAEEGEKPAEEGEKPAEEGEKKPAEEGEKPAEEGEKKEEEGEQQAEQAEEGEKQAEDQKKAVEAAEEKPAEDSAKPADD